MNHVTFSSKRRPVRFLIPAYIFLVITFSFISVAASGNFVASKNSDVYHVSSCYYVDRIKDSNKVWYDSPEAAEAAGKRGCSKCKPEQYKTASPQADEESSSALEPRYIVEDSEEYWELWQRGYDEGYTSGYSDGTNSVEYSHDSGYDAGYDVGLADGREYGYADGYKEGKTEASRQNEELQEELNRTQEDKTFRIVIVGLAGLAAGGAGGYYVQKRKSE